MFNQTTNPNTDSIQNPFNLQGGQDVLKMWASMNERMTALLVASGTRSVDIMSNTSKEALSNLREVTQVRKNPSDYAQAYGDFTQKQVALLKNIAQNFGELTQKAGAETAELTSKASEDMSGEIAENVHDVADKASENAKDFTNRASANFKDAAAKTGVTAQKTA